MYIIKKIIGLFMKKSDFEITDIKKKFINLNRSLWKEKKSNNKFLVITQCTYPASIMEFLPIVKNLENELDLEILALLPGKRKNNINNACVFESYGVNNFVFINKIKILVLVKALFETIKIFFKIDNGEDLLRLNHKGINIGEPIYDTIIRDINNSVTIDKIKIKYFKYILIAVYMNLVFKNIISDNDIKYAFIVEEIGYSPYGIFLRQLSQKREIITYMQSYNRGVFRKINDTRESITIKLNVAYVEERIKNDNSLIKLANKYMEDRIKGNSNSLLVEGYNRKKVYTREGMTKLFKIENSKKNVVLAIHCFRDAAHYSEDSLYKDYFVWMIETIKILTSNENINVFIKEHPAAGFYSENGIIEKTLEKLEINNIYFLPSDFSTASIIDCMDYVVTACGTMALEMSCFGIPGITTSKGYYFGLGIDINVNSVEDYQSLLSEIHNINRLGLDVQDKAKKIMYLISEDRMKIDLLPSGLFYDNMEYLLDVNKQWEYFLGKIKKDKEIDWFSKQFKFNFQQDYILVEKWEDN